MCSAPHLYVPHATNHRNDVITLKLDNNKRRAWEFGIPLSTMRFLLSPQVVPLFSFYFEKQEPDSIL